MKHRKTKRHKYANTHIYAYRVSDPSVMVMSNEVFMREREIESALVASVRKKHGLALKLISPGFDGVPDRLILFPDGRVGFIELKKPGQKMRPLQEKRKRQLEGLGFLVFCVDSKDQIEEVLHAIQST